MCRANSNTGISREYKEDSKFINTTNLDVNGKAMTAAVGCDCMETSYDADWKTEEYFVDGNCKLVNSEYGFAKMTYAHNENTGWDIETRCFNSAEEPVMVSGVERIEYEYDKDGNKNMTRKYDAADELIQDADGVAYTSIEYEHDALKRPVKETFMDVNVCYLQGVRIHYKGIQPHNKYCTLALL